jgi:hypothetical protein
LKDINIYKISWNDTMNNLWVEWWENPNKKSGSHAQMSVNLTLAEEPASNKVNRRFFDTKKAAAKFAKVMAEHGNVTRIRSDRSY